MTRFHRRRHGAFTLVELLVVISIIALLIAVLLPSMSAIRRQAKETAVRAQFAALNTAIESYREDAPSGTYPPSSTDDSTDKHAMASPLGTTAAANTKVSGSHLLLQALLGDDLLGTPGFRDLNRNGRWSDDTHMGDGGAYELDQDQEVKVTRYGGAEGYVSADMKLKSVSTLQEMVDTSRIIAWTGPVAASDTRNLKLFNDDWGLPILYYKANKAAKRMVWAAAKTGTYRQQDNGFITGSQQGDGDSFVGIDFGPGVLEGTDTTSRIGQAVAPAPKDPLDAPALDNSFARFIHNSKVLARNEAVNKDSYLLISAGADEIYGTADDITNWSRDLE